MMLQEFVGRYKGKKVDFDGMYGAQCVDLVRQYFQDVWGLRKNEQPEGVNGAEDFYFKHESRPIQKRLCDCVMYKPGMIPPTGAVAVFRSWQDNRFGHIGIVIAANENVIDLFEQDGFAQDGAKITKWRYDRLAGWLLKKEQ